jgi:ABC-2 type transport system permease protein/sodium transport system permease protein
MLVSLGPGFMSVMPGLELGPLLSVIPLANIVLLARDVLEGDAPALWGSVAVLTTLLYGAFALALAARIFGSDAILYGSQNSWGDLLRRPDQPRSQATVSGVLTALAIVAPLFVIAGGILAQFQSIAMSAQLMATAGTTLFLFLVLPAALARMQGVSIRDGFQLRGASPLALAGGVLLGVSLWPLAYDLIILCQDLGLATLSREKLAENRPGLDALLDRWRSMPIAAVLLAMAVAPAVCEELFFRGYLLGALRGRMRAWGAIALTGAVFGLFHASVGGLIAVERIISSAFLGLVLGWVCWVSRSVLPGMLLHVLNNGLMLALAYYAPRLQAWGWDAANQRYLPMMVVAVACLGVVGGLAAVWIGRLQPVATGSALPEATTG